MSKTLVAFFSASGVTEKVAGRLASVLQADLYEIKPEVKYTSADLNWRDKNSRSSVEMSDRTSRPKLADNDAGINKYDTVYVGFPIWWYREPSIIDTFMESYDFTEKKVYVFATSGGSDLGEAAENIQKLAVGAKVKKLGRLKANVTEKELSDLLGVR